MHSHSIALIQILLLFPLGHSFQSENQGNKPPYQRMLQGVEARKAEELKSKNADAINKENYPEAIKFAEELYALRQAKQGTDHWQTIDTRWNVDLLKRAAALEPAQRRAWLASEAFVQQASQHLQKNEYSQAFPLLEERIRQCQTVAGDRHLETATGLQHLGLALSDGRKYTEAITCLQKAIGLYRDLSAEIHPGAAICYLKLAQALQGLGKQNEATPHFRRALALKVAIYGEKHLETATNYRYLGNHLEKVGNAAEALAMFQKAFDVRRELLGKRHSHTESSYDDLALLLMALGDSNKAKGNYQNAEAYYQRCLHLTRELLGEHHTNIVVCYSNLGSCKEHLGKFAEAILFQQQAIAIQRELTGEYDPVMAMLCSNYAMTLHTQGNHAEALLLIRKALEIQHAVIGEKHVESATMYGRLAIILDGQKKYEEAYPFHLQALAIRRKMLGDNHRLIATSYNSLALHFDSQGKYKQAEQHYLKALQLRRELLGERHEFTAQSYHNLALNLMKQQRYQEAQEYHQLALDLNRSIFGDGHPSTITSYGNLAMTMRAQNKHAEAITYINKALEHHHVVFGDYHHVTKSLNQSLAACLHVQGKYEEEYLALQKAASAYEYQRLIGHDTGAERATANMQSMYPKLAVSAARSGRILEACVALEAGLGRGLLDELPVSLSPILTVSDETRKQELLKQFSDVNKDIFRLIAKENSLEQDRQIIQKLTVKRSILEKDLHEVVVIQNQREIASAESIQASLPPDAALVCWIDTQDIADIQDHWACIIRSGKPQVWESLPGKSANKSWSIDERLLVQKFRQAIISSNSPSEIDRLAQELYQQRFSPIEKHLAGIKHLFIVPVGSLAGVPVEAITRRYTISYVPSGTIMARLIAQPRSPQAKTILALGDPVFRVPGQVQPAAERLPPGGLLITQVTPGGVAAQARLLPGDVLLSYAGTDLTEGKQLAPLVAQHANDRSVMIRLWRESEDKIAVREIAPGKMSVVVAMKPAPEALAAKRQADQLLAGLRANHWTELPGTRVEIAQLTKLAGDKVTLLTGSDASEQSLQALNSTGALKQFAYLHLATHGETNPRAFESALILAQDQLPDPTRAPPGKPVADGRLTAREVLESWQLNAELVTLSACESGIGRSGGGDGLLGFSQAFLRAGARAVCLSLWKVDDAATALLMNRFYHNLLVTKLPKGQALAEAKLWLRELSLDEATKLTAEISQGVARGKDAPAVKLVVPIDGTQDKSKATKPFAHPRYWAAFILMGDPD